MRTITIMGNPTATVVALSEPTGPRPAVGKHAELLEDITQAANALLRLVEAERFGAARKLVSIWQSSTADCGKTKSQTRPRPLLLLVGLFVVRL